MTEMWLVRHGQTDWNLNGIYQGQSDIPLNVTGESQARELAATLVDTRFDAIYSSDLIRARRTAEIIAEALNLPIATDPRLREINQGVWEGQSIQAVRERYNPDFSRNPKYITTPRADGAESLADVIIRMVAAANDFNQAHHGGRLILCTHGLSAAALYCVVKGIPLVDVVTMIPDNGQPLVIHVNNNISLPEFNYKNV